MADIDHVIVHEGKRAVALALMQEAYVPTFVRWINAHTSVEGTLQRPPYTHSAGVEWVRGLDKSKGRDEVFAVLLREGDPARRQYRYIGHMGIHGVVWPHGFGTTGSILGDPEIQGKGYGTEAKLLIMHHAFMVMGLRKLTSTVKAFNVKSGAHLLKCGYQYAGRLRKHHQHRGGYVDELLFDVLREDWQPIWDTYQQTNQPPKLSHEQREFMANQFTP